MSFENDIVSAQLANAEADRLEALDEAELATDRVTSYRIELKRLHAEMRQLQSRLKMTVDSRDTWRSRAIRFACEASAAREYSCTRTRCPFRAR